MAPALKTVIVRILRALTVGTTLWWSYELCALASERRVDSPTLSADRSDYACVPGMAAWVVVACACSILDVWLAQPLLLRIRMTGLVVAYAWSAATLSKFDHTYRGHHAGLVGLGVQTASVACAILDEAYRVEKKEKEMGEDPPPDVKSVPDSAALPADAGGTVARRAKTMRI